MSKELIVEPTEAMRDAAVAAWDALMSDHNPISHQARAKSAGSAGRGKIGRHGIRHSPRGEDEEGEG